MANRLDGSVVISRITQQIDFNAWVGLPYRDRGRGPDAYDCWGLVAAVYSQAGIVLPSYSEEYVTAEDRTAIADLVHGNLQPWHEIAESDIRPLDGILVRVGAHEAHIGMAVRRGYMLHVGLGVGPSRIERYDLFHLKKRISRFMRHEALA